VAFILGQRRPENSDPSVGPRPFRQDNWGISDEVEIDPHTGEAVDHRLSKISAAEWEQLQRECPLYGFTDIRHFLTYFEQHILPQKDEGVLLFDSDNTLRPHAIGRGMKTQRFGSIPQDIFNRIKALHNYLRDSWSMAVVSNQPEQGHQVAGIVHKQTGEPVFPHSLREEGIEVFGGDWLFPIHVYKNSDRSVIRTVEWIMRERLGPLLRIKDNKAKTLQLMGVGDRPTDIEFYRKVAHHLKCRLHDLDHDEITCQWKLFMVGKPGSTNDARMPAPEDKLTGLARFFARLRP
jgi:hypothetical protein